MDVVSYILSKNAVKHVEVNVEEVKAEVAEMEEELDKKVNKDELGSSAFLDVPVMGDAADNEVVLGCDSRLSDARTPVAHTHLMNEISDLPTLGTVVTYDIPVMGDALADEVVMGDDSRLTDTRDPNPHTHDLSDITDAGTAASKNVAASGDAATTEVVMGNDSRLTDSRDPNPHSHEVADITDFPSLGTASAKNVPSSGDAGNDEVVLGNDSRLSDARPSSDVTNTYSSSGTVPVSGKAVAAALGTLDVSSVGGNNKYISEISETDGKISAIAETIDTTVTKDSTNIVTSGAVWAAIDNLPEPMVFRGSLGSGGTISALPVDGSATVGDTYKVITDGTYAGQDAKVGDLFSCLTRTSSANTWEYFPSGDEPSGTVISVKIEASSPIVVDDDSAITTSGTRVLSHANSGVTAGTYTSVTVDAKGHVTDGSNPDISYNDLVDKPTLGTAAALDVPASGNASSGQVVKGDDSRLTDARNAADVYAWAKEENKPSYTKSEVGLGNVDNTSDVNKPISTATQTALDNKVDKIDGKGLSTNDYTTTEKNKLTGIESGAEVNIQADWNENDNTSDAFINNKPTSMPASDVYSWAKAANKPSYTASEVGAVPAYVAGGTNNITALQSLFQDHNIAKSVGVSARLEHGSHSMAFGWFLDGYDYSSAYGGWFISDYATPSWVGVQNGEWTENKYFAFKDEIPDISGKLDKTGGTLTGELISQNGGIWIQGGSAAGGNYNRLITVGGMPAEMQYDHGKRGTRLYSNGIAFCDPYNGNNNNDSAWIRHIEETVNNGTLEIAVGDDAADEVIAVRRYNTSNNIANEILLFDKNGYTIYGTSIAINPNQGGSYNEGLRINKASNGWSTLTMGGAAGSVTGTGDNVWFLGCNASGYNHRFMIGHNSGGDSGTYWYVDSSSQTSPYLKVGGDIRADRYIYANYFNQSSGAETPTADSYWFYCNSDGFLRKSTRVAAREALLNNKATVDLSTLDEDTYYPVTASIADGSWGEGYIHMIVSVQLNSGTSPSWSTHSAGFSTHVDIYDTPCGWGTIPAKGICIANNFGWCSSQPVGYRQMRNSSTAVFYLRGGGKYFIYSGHLMTWTIRTEDYTTSYETVGPTTSYPGISFHDGFADICVPMVEVSSNSSWKDIKVRDRNKLGRAFFYDIYNDDGPESYGNVIELVSTHENHWQPQIWLGGWTGGHIMYRNKGYADDTWGAWKTVWDSENLTNLNQLTNGPGYITSSDSCASATIGNRPRGFASQDDTFSWGNQTGTAITVWNDSTGGSIGFRRDNPVNGQMSMIIDGTVYVDEGRYSVIHTGNIGSQSVNYATSAGSVPTLTATSVESANVDTMYTTGLYQIKSLESGQTLPVSVWACLQVINYLHNGTYERVYQYVWHDAEGNNPDQYMRTCYNGTWSNWKKIAFADGTGASGTWGINITGNADYAESATTATYSSYPKITSTNEIRFDVSTKMPNAGPLYIGYAWSDGTKDANITKYIFQNGNATNADIEAANFIGNLSGTATKATQDSDGNVINTTYLKLSGGTLTGTLTSRSITPSSSNTYNIGSSTAKFNNIYVNYTNTDYVFADNGVVGSYYYVNDDYPIILFQETTSSGDTGTYDHETYLRKKHIGVDVGPSTYYDLYLPEASGTLAITDDIARYYAVGTSSTTSGSWKNGGNASITITVPGTYLFAAWANFSSTSKTQGIRLYIGNSAYNQNIVNMNYGQAITMSTLYYASVAANTVAKTQVYTSAAEMVTCWIVAIRLA